MQTAITNRQKGVIHQQAGMLGIEDDTYRDRLENMFGVRSCKELTAVQATELIQSFERDGAVLNTNFRKWTQSRKAKAAPRSGTRKKGGNVTGIASEKQKWLMDLLKRLIEWKVEDGFTRWIEKTYKISRVKTDRQAHMVISGMQKMFRHQMTEKDGKDWKKKHAKSDNPDMLKWLKYYG